MPIGFNKNVAEKDTDELDDLRDDEEVTNKPQNKKILIIAGAATMLVVGCVLFARNGVSSEKETPQVPPEIVEISTEDDSVSGNGVYDEEGNVVDPNGITPGQPDYQHSTNNTTSSKVFDVNDYVKDINGLDVSAVYQEASLEYVVDYVSYVAHRGLVDNGMEMYWLDVEYNGLKYKMQVPFYYFKDLKETGICRVEMEIIHTMDGGKIISYMHIVSENYTGG